MTDAPTIPIVNTDMAELWDGDEGDEWTENADRYDATDRWIARRFDAEVEIGRSDRVLDVGCGTGRSSRDAARRARDGTVLGIDLSSRMLDHARRRSEAEGLHNVGYVRGDAQVHPFEPGAHDLTISTFGAMFFVDPVAAFANIRQGLRPGGGIAFLAWQRFEANRWLTAIFDAVAVGRELPTPASGDPGPFGLADHTAVRGILGDAGYVDADLVSLIEPFCLGGDADDAFAFVSTMGIVRGLIDDLTGDERRRALGNLRELIAAHETADGVLIESATWLITATAP